jgi:hypothetical protein
MPVVGRTYLVEFTVRHELDWGVDIEAVDELTEPKLEPFFAGTFIEGRLESYADDGCAVLRLGPSVIMIQTSGEAPSVGTWVRATVSDMELYEVGAS